MRRVLLALLMVGVLCPKVFACGRERWPVKVATDPDAQQILAAPEPTNIALLSLVPPPLHPENRAASRYAPTELTTFVLTASLVVIKPEKDEDYHIVLRDEHGRTLIVESPNPHCGLGSRFTQELAAVRTKIDAHFGGPIIQKIRRQNLRVTVTGVGFFDRIHGQEGVAQNGIELHPHHRYRLQPVRGMVQLHRLRGGSSMPRGRHTAIKIDLTPEERQTLTARQRSTSISAGHASLPHHLATAQTSHPQAPTLSLYTLCSLACFPFVKLLPITNNAVPVAETKQRLPS